MRYAQVQQGWFLARPNRFIALVELDGKQVVCHVKNTGRCQELLQPGAEVILAEAQRPDRKTAYDLIAVYKEQLLINIDSQAPNQVAEEYLKRLFPGLTSVRREYRVGDSRLDLYAEVGERQVYIEVKGCTLEKEGIAMFPDAPTARGVKHLHTLIKLAAEGKEAWMLFVIQMDGPRCFQPNDNIDPAFGQALRKAAAAGVRIHAVDCCVEKGGLFCQNPISVLLP